MTEQSPGTSLRFFQWDAAAQQWSEAGNAGILPAGSPATPIWVLPSLDTPHSALDTPHFLSLGGLLLSEPLTLTLFPGLNPLSSPRLEVLPLAKAWTPLEAAETEVVSPHEVRFLHLDALEPLTVSEEGTAFGADAQLPAVTSVRVLGAPPRVAVRIRPSAPDQPHYFFVLDLAPGESLRPDSPWRNWIPATATFEDGVLHIEDRLPESPGFRLYQVMDSTQISGEGLPTPVIPQSLRENQSFLQGLSDYRSSAAASSSRATPHSAAAMPNSVTSNPQHSNPQPLFTVFTPLR